MDDFGRETSDKCAGGGRAEKPSRTHNVARRAVPWSVGTTRVFVVVVGKLERAQATLEASLGPCY
jgi:hypothetical protein